MTSPATNPMPTSTDGRPRTVERSTLRRGKKYSLELLRFRTSSGVAVEKEIVRHPGSVVVLPVLRAPDGSPRVVLIRNWRATVEEHVTELPAGTREAGEPPAQCAARELEEETGYRAGRLVELGSFFTAPGLTDERMWAFVASELTPTRQRIQPDEEIDVLQVHPAEAFEMIATGQLHDAKSMLTLLLASSTGRLTEA
jgi:ADP-ribose pyrophosphatase